jgi:guanylate kinase
LSNSKKPFILILSGPSGAGKTTLSNALVDAIPDTVIAISHTTRAPRPGEKNGNNYHFIDRQEFMRLINNGQMLEHAEVYDNFYGTSQGSIEASLGQRKNVILDIDWQGARKMKSLYPSALSVYIVPPDKDETKNRLIARQQDSAEVIKSRMSGYKEQQSHQSEYDHTVINDKLADATQQLIRILNFG